jgi:uncharacterized protein YgbK (DUF1537 family)
MATERYVVLDDDPTGTQSVQDVPVFLKWSADPLRAALAGSPSVHLLTNARALSADQAELVTYDAAATALAADPGARLVLRGDSTLRGHLLPEYRAADRAGSRGRPLVLMLVPALPAAGRVTRDGIHYAGSLPVHETDYARDGVFSYHSSRLLEWAQERTDGLLPAHRGIEVPLHELRSTGSDAVLRAVRSAAERAPAVVAPDAVTMDDLELIAEGARAAYAEQLPLLVRGAPAFAGVLTRTSATEFVPAPHAQDGLLVVCGSYVARTTAQLEHLYASCGIAPVELDLDKLLDGDEPAADEIARAARAVDEHLAADGIAVLATPRERPASAQNLTAGQRIAKGLAHVVPRLTHLPGVILTKGGITSHVTVADGLGCDRADVAGPIATGVALWQIVVRERRLDCLIFPGNVGDDEHLARVVSIVLGR